MELIRSLRPEDIPAVAGLFQKVFRHTSSPPSAKLVSYFAEIYLYNPWRDDAISSLVHIRDGLVAGFLGAIPFPMQMNGKPIRAAIGGNYMIDPDHPNPLAGVRLLKTLLSGPQDLTYSDTATAIAQNIWTGLRSTTVHSYGMQWLRIIKPFQFGLAMGIRNTRLAPFATLLRPLTGLADYPLRSFSKSPFHVGRCECDYADATSASLLDPIRSFSSKDALRPDYTEDSLSWLLQMAAEKTEFGPLKKKILYSRQKELLGWYLYYPNAGGIGQVLQFGATQKTADTVLSLLLADAQAEGSLALAGRLEPKFQGSLSRHNCLFVHRNSSLVVHSNNAEITNAFCRGDAFFTRLEGEWWTRLQGDFF